MENKFLTNIEIPNMENILKQANERSVAQSTLNKLRTNKGTKIIAHTKNEKILVRNKPKLKQDPLWLGPYTITRTSNDHVEYLRNNILTKANKNNIKKYVEPGCNDQSTPISL